MAQVQDGYCTYFLNIFHMSYKFMRKTVLPRMLNMRDIHVVVSFKFFFIILKSKWEYVENETENFLNLAVPTFVYRKKKRDTIERHHYNIGFKCLGILHEDLGLEFCIKYVSYMQARVTIPHNTYIYLQYKKYYNLFKEIIFFSFPSCITIESYTVLFMSYLNCT